MSNKEQKETNKEKSPHEFYSIDVPSDYQFTELDNLLMNIVGGLPIESLTDEERKMILEKYPNFFDEEEERNEEEERMREATHAKGSS